MKTMEKVTGHADGSSYTSQKEDTNKRKERTEQTMEGQQIFFGEKKEKQADRLRNYIRFLGSVPLWRF